MTYRMKLFVVLGSLVVISNGRDRGGELPPL